MKEIKHMSPAERTSRSTPTPGLLPHGFAFRVIRPDMNASWVCNDSHIYGNYCRSDNSTLTANRSLSLSQQGDDNIATALMGQYGDLTDLETVWDPTPSYSGDAETDIIYKHADRKDPYVRYTWCDDAVSSEQCDQHYVQFDSATPAVGLACHETGHAVGLTHGEDSYPAVSNTNNDLHCMVTPFDPARIYIGDLQKYWINHYY